VLRRLVACGAEDEGIVKSFGLGARIGDRYVVESVLARGGMGAVYRAIDERLTRPVAIKVLLDELAEDRTSLARFEREARAAAGLSHPGIVQVYDFGASEGVSYLVMELVQGHTLAQELGRLGRIPPLRAADIIEQALGALATAHAAGIVHRDLKPGNLMVVPLGPTSVAEGGRELVKVLDFGIAQLKQGEAYARLTQTGVVLGTPMFMAPEQAHGQPLDARTDVYAMGVLLWCCLTGQKPFAARDVAGILERVLGEVPPRADLVVPGVPTSIALIAERAMQKAPMMRWPSASAFAAALVQARGGVTSVPNGPEARPLVVEAATVQAKHLPVAPRTATPVFTGPSVAPAVTSPMGQLSPIAIASSPAMPMATSPGSPARSPAPVAMLPPLAAPSIAGPSIAVPSSAPTRSIPTWLRVVLALVLALGVLGIGAVALVAFGLFAFDRSGWQVGGLLPPALTPTAASSPVCAAAYRCCLAVGVSESTCNLYPSAPVSACESGLTQFVGMRHATGGDDSMCIVSTSAAATPSVVATPAPTPSTAVTSLAQMVVLEAAPVLRAGTIEACSAGVAHVVFPDGSDVSVPMSSVHPLHVSAGDHVTARWHESSYPAVIVATRDSSARVRWGDESEEWIELTDIQSLEGEATGTVESCGHQHVLVDEGGRSHVGRVIACEGAFATVLDASGTTRRIERATATRLPLRVGDSIEARWRGTAYAAVVLSLGELVHVRWYDATEGDVQPTDIVTFRASEARPSEPVSCPDA